MPKEILKMGFEGKIALITGAARGIGRAISETLAARGADIIIADLQSELAEQTAKEVSEATQRRTLAVSVNVAEQDSVISMVGKALETFGRIDILVNNAGVTRDKLILRMEEEDWDLVLNVNLKGAFNCCKAVFRPMMRQRYGRIINISSVSGQAGQTGQANYSSSKAGLIGLTKALAREFASRNITVNAVAPGFIPTILTQDLPPELKESIIKATPLGRMGTPQEIAYAVAFLASDEAAFITGQVVAVDGGMVMM
jgi:3-oxoacyl-[acyl-carrier protein] reductase